MGCSVGKTSAESCVREIASPNPRQQKYSTSIQGGNNRFSGSLRFSTSTPTSIMTTSHQPLSADNATNSNSNNNNNNAIANPRRSVSMMHGNSRKPIVLQVDYISDPAETDQITAKITRSSPNPHHNNHHHKKSIDQGGWSPSTASETKNAKFSQSPTLQPTMPSKQISSKAVSIVQEHSELEENASTRHHNQQSNSKKDLQLQGVLKKTNDFHLVL